LKDELLAQCATLHLRGIQCKPGSSAEDAMVNWNAAVRAKRISDFMAHLNDADAIRVNNGDFIARFEWSIINFDTPDERCLVIQCTRNESSSLTLTESQIGSGHFEGGEFSVMSRGKTYTFSFFVLKQFGDLRIGRWPTSTLTQRENP
jgi:hypothetical protein